MMPQKWGWSGLKAAKLIREAAEEREYADMDNHFI